MLKFVCFLPTLQSWANILYAFPSCLQRIIPASIGDVLRELVIVEYVWVSLQSIGYAFRLIGRICQWVSQWLMMESAAQFVGSMSLCRVPMTLLEGSKSPGCCFPSCFPLPSHATHSSTLSEMRKNWVSLTVPHIAGEAEQSLTYSHSPLWEKSWVKVSFGTELCHLGEGVT